MNRETLIIFALVIATSLSGALAAVAVQERKTKKVTRVKRPQFTQRDWDGIYFEDLFEEGLVGDRPKRVDPGQQLSTNGQVAGGSSSESADRVFAWSRYISGSTIEDEVKLIQAQLAKDITTPVKFKSEYDNAHQSFSILSMLFGIIREYDGDVRWKKFAGEAQASFERAAANSRVGTIQAYESCKRRKGDLEEMVRGGNFAGREKPPEQLDWSIVVDRTPIMVRLQQSRDALKQLTAAKGAFTSDVEKVYHESQLVAALAQTLVRENMMDIDDDEYVEFAKSMSGSANQLTEACENQGYESAATAANLMGQACDNCHDGRR
jgi:hypothetical protein